MIKGLEQISVAVKSIDEYASFFRDVLGLEITHQEEISEQGVKAALIPVGDGEIELIEPTDPEGGVARFLERRGEGLHHICFIVDDVDEELRALEAKGVELIDKVGRRGVQGRKVAFLHPRSTKGILIELAEEG